MLIASKNPEPKPNWKPYRTEDDGPDESGDYLVTYRFPDRPKNEVNVAIGEWSPYNGYSDGTFEADEASWHVPNVHHSAVVIAWMEKPESFED